MQESLELPFELRSTRKAHPWESVAASVRDRLALEVPELSGFIASLNTAVFGLESGFFYLPVAQASAWGINDSEWLEELLLLLAIGHVHFASQDMIVDEGGCPAELCLLSDVCLLMYLDGLADHAPSSDPLRYRRLHDVYYGWYLRALTSELTHRRQLAPFAPNEIINLGLKAAPGNTIVHLIADRADRSIAADGAVRAVMQLCTGLQLLDDLNDLEVDARDGNYTMPLTSTLLAAGLGPTSEVTELEELIVHAATAGVASASIDISQHFFDLAAQNAAKAGADVIADMAQTWHRRAAARRATIDDALDSEGIRR